MMRVELVAHNPIESVSGIGRYIRELYEHLIPNIPVRVAYPIDPPLTKYFSFLHSLPLGLKNHENGGLVHFPQIMGCAMMIWNPIRPSIATIHDLGVLELPEEWGMFDPIARQLLRLSFVGLRKMDLIITDSEFSRRGVIKHLGLSHDRVITIYLGIDHQTFFPEVNAREELLSKYHLLNSFPGPWLLYVGSELPRKNFATLLQAVAILKEKYPQVHLIKIGTSGGKAFRCQTLRTIEALDLGESVSFFEGISDQELRMFYSAADVFILPSRLEGFGFPVLEAMACGTPVVCSGAASLPEIAGEAAILFDPMHVKSLASIIANVLQDDILRKQLVSKGITQAADFTWEKTSNQMIRVYLGLA